MFQVQCCTINPWTTLGLNRVGPLRSRYSSVVNSAVLYYPRLVEPASTETELRILRVREYGGTVDKEG